MAGRARAAQRRAQRQQEAWDPDQQWHKYARCFICHGRFVCNNNAERKVRVNHLKVHGHIICPWCKSRRGEDFVKLWVFTQALALRRCPLKDQEGHKKKTCKSVVCTARRLIT